MPYQEPAKDREPQIFMRHPRHLEAALRQADMSGNELAKAVGLSRQYVNRMRSGERQSVRYRLAVKMERALKVTSGTVFVYGDDPDVDTEPDAAAGPIGAGGL